MNPLIIIYVFVPLCFCSPYSLTPDYELFDQTINPGESIFYILGDLKPNSAYEIRVSYPATMPANFEIAFANANLKTRKLLNTEKLMFRTDENNLIMGELLKENQKNFMISVTATRDAVSLSEEARKRPIHYNIVVETLFDVGVYAIPFDVFKIAAIIAPVLFIIFTLVIPQFFSFFHALFQRDHEHEQ